MNSFRDEWKFNLTTMGAKVKKKLRSSAVSNEKKKKKRKSLRIKTVEHKSDIKK